MSIDCYTLPYNFIASSQADVVVSESCGQLQRSNTKTDEVWLVIWLGQAVQRVELQGCGLSAGLTGSDALVSAQQCQGSSWRQPKIIAASDQSPSTISPILMNKDPSDVVLSLNLSRKQETSCIFSYPLASMSSPSLTPPCIPPVLVFTLETQSQRVGSRKSSKRQLLAVCHVG